MEKKSKVEKKKRTEEIINIPEGVEVEVDKEIKIVGKKGALKKQKKSKDIILEKRGQQIVIYSKKGVKKKDKRGGKKIGSIKAHIKNMIKGVTEGHFYKLKICASHFPMNVTIENNKLVVKNFLGEKIPRILKLDKLDKDNTIRIDGNEILVEGTDKEAIAQTAADIEQLCKITNRDKRVFQDGIFIIDKDGKEVR